ncbi:MAG TPA: family 20 glycosylhydrolase [Candidatus Didemnitutus sp.]|nr:family 20 glycosylhydrolase [Candidatus Didemnitutus sp.]
MIRAFQWDLARQVERMDFLHRDLKRHAAWGFNELYLHLEDAVHYPSLPGVGRDDALSYEQLGELVLSAAKAKVGVVPIVNLLGHTQYLIRHPDWNDLNELRDERGRARPQGQICPLHPRTLEAADRLLRDLAPYCTTGRVHVGLDESFHLGKCERCRDEVRRIGLAGHFAGHVRRLHAIAGSHGLQLGMWADMLYFTPEAITLLPSGITAYDWYYYAFPRHPRVEFFNFAERDLTQAFRTRGIRYFGCPMNGAFRHEPLPVFGDRLANIRSWWRRCREVEAEGFLITSWESSRLAQETASLVDAAAADLWSKPGNDDPARMLASGLERQFGVRPALPMARRLLAADDHAFSGYARWQINDRWDVQGGTESTRPFEAEERFFERLERLELPAALQFSVRFRRYLATRDVFVRRAARTVARWRRWVAREDLASLTPAVAEARKEAATFGREIRAARAAARSMWNRTRDRQVSGSNEGILTADAARLSAWKDFLKDVAREPAAVKRANPVEGAWHLQFWVHNFAPAVQKVVVERQDAAGAWHEVASRYTIEFRAFAARPNVNIRREFVAPIDAPNVPVRIGIRGVGQVGISHAVVTNGVVAMRAEGYRERRILGEAAPTRGLPSLDDGSVLSLVFPARPAST